jgi:hypothetical protein
VSQECFKGSTSRTTYIELVDSTTGLPKTGVVFGDCTGSYVRTRSARTAITMATLASASAAFSSGGFILVDDTNQPGVYRLDVPDAAFATGVEEVVVTIKAAGCRTVSKGFVLVDWNKQVAAIPNVAAGASGGLPTVDASNAVKLQSGTGANQISLAAGLVTAGTVGDKTGYALSTAPPTAAAILAAMNAAPPDVNVASVDGGLLTSPTVDANVVSVDGSLLTSPVVDANVVSIEAGLLTSPDVTVAAGSIADIAEAVRDVDNTAPAADSLGEAINAGGGGGGGGATAADVWAYATRTLSTAPPTAAAVAAEVWDTAPSGPTLEDIAEAVRDVSNASPTAGSLGEAINSAASAGDPWSTTIPGSYGSGTAGKIIGDNLNATVTSRMATFSYQPPPAANAIRDAVWTGSTRELTAGGLDAISTTLNATPTNFPQWIVWLTTRFRRTRKNKTTGVISVYGTDGTTIITTQTSTDTTGEQTTGVPS